MEPIQLLRRLLATTTPATISGDETARQSGLFPAAELRFTLEYATPPELDGEAQAIARLLESEAFVLERVADDPALDRFVVLRFPGLERTLPQRELFAIAYALADRLALVSAEPDVGADVFADPVAPGEGGRAESVDLVTPLCFVSGSPPENPRWALEASGVPAAWNKTKGAGILIGQPDTGVARHDEFDAQMLRLDKAIDLIDGGTEGRDPLHRGMANPGHGTSTASVVVASGERGAISGVAPAAQLVPIRCINDVKVFNQAPVAAAIAYARKVGCHVITMSLGGVPSRALHASLRAAVADNLIVVAAAGNCVRTVVWPARYDEAIAVAASNVADRLWKGSSRGLAVDIAAPGEMVWRAYRSTPDESTSQVRDGQGTSYAVAIVAGVAALWLAHHGRDRLIAYAQTRAVSLQALFRAALHKSARRPHGWDSSQAGPGIVDAAALLDLPLDAIPLAGTESVGLRSPVEQMLLEEHGHLPQPSGFDWQRYGCELATISLAQARALADPSGISRESKTSTTRPSRQLAAAVDASGDEVLRKFGEEPGHTSVARPPAPASEPVRRALLRKALALSHTTLESSPEGFDADKAIDYLRGNGTNEQLDRLTKVLDASGNQPADTRADVLKAVSEGIEQVVRGWDLSPNGLFGLETLVKLTGRPALRTSGGSINLDDPRASEWKLALYFPVEDGTLKTQVQSVGRIDVDGVHVGTGFVVGDGLVLTNRHVLQEFAAPIPRHHNPEAWLLTSDRVTIDFADEPSSLTASSRFVVKSVIGAGPRHVSDSFLDFGVFDAALLEVERVNAAGEKLPPSLPPSAEITLADRHSNVLTIGYPAAPRRLPADETGQTDMRIFRRLHELFNGEYGRRYLSPGQVMVAPGASADDTAKWLIRHDATTLPGSSGSSLVALFGKPRLIGLHFGGSWMRENYAHWLGRAKTDADIFLSTAPISWK